MISSTNFQIGAIYMWSYVYNIVRIYSSNDSEGDKQDVISNGPKCTGGSSETLSKCSSPPLLPLKDNSQNEDNVDRFKLSCSMSNGKEKVI